MNREIVPLKGAYLKDKWIGVSLNPKSDKYRSFIFHPVLKKTINFGSYDTAYDAAKARFFELQKMSPEISRRIGSDFVPDVNDYNTIRKLSATSPLSFYSNATPASNMANVTMNNAPLNTYVPSDIPYPNKYNYMNMIGVPYERLHEAENRFYEEQNAENEDPFGNKQTEKKKKELDLSQMHFPYAADMANEDNVLPSITHEIYGMVPHNSNNQPFTPIRMRNNTVPEYRKRLFSNAEGGSRKHRRMTLKRKKRYLSSARSQRYKK
jgi:hypothetical protein